MAKTPKQDPQPTTPDDGKSAFVVADKAPMKVAGRRVKPGDVLRLTEDEARGELLALHIRPQAETSTAE